MTDWTKTIERDGVEYKTNMTGTHVTVSTIHGSFTDSVSNIRSKLKDRDLLPEVRRMFECMLEFYEKEKRTENDSNYQGEV